MTYAGRKLSKGEMVKLSRLSEKLAYPFRAEEKLVLKPEPKNGIHMLLEKRNCDNCGTLIKLGSKVRVFEGQYFHLRHR